MWTVASYVLWNKLRGQKRYPLVLMLEPLMRCNLACAGCGKIQHPPEILRRQLSPEQCFQAAEECRAPIVSIPGGEPLLHPQIDQIVAGLVSRRKYVYLCTNAIKLEESLPKFTPSKYFSFSIHLDGPREEHDAAVCRDGIYDLAVNAIRAAVAAGFRVTTNTTLFNDANPQRLREFFNTMMDLGVEGMMISPGYRYAKAPNQDHFLPRQQTVHLFQRLLDKAPRKWRFNHSPLFLEFLRGQWKLECTPWGNPTYNVFGWQKPCYLLDDGYTQTFQELLDTTDWGAYGRASGNPRCQDCMVHCGYEPTAVSETFGSLRGMWAAARSVLFGMQPLRQPLAVRASPEQPVEPLLPLLSTASSGKTACQSNGCKPIESNFIPSSALLPIMPTTGQDPLDDKSCTDPALTFLR
jgi:hopanoid biosynthesis associated radical SAM protein HpnH